MNSDFENTIDSESVSPLDYDQMKALGLKYIQKIAHQNWTDFNVHDPGVTIWEALCFSLSDLAYRTNFDVKDLLTKEGSNQPTLGGSLPSPQDILSSNPLTVKDYKKLILENVKGVRNVWIEPKEWTVVRYGNLVRDELLRNTLSVNGFYEVSIQCEEKGVDKSKVSENVTTLLNRHRNLCEKFLPLKLLKPVDVGICVELEVEKYSDLSSIVREIHRRVDEYISPSIPHYSVSELLAKGKTYEEIFQGGLDFLTPDGENRLDNFLGFVDRDELDRFEKRKKLYTSDLVNIIMRIEGVIRVTHLHFMYDKDSKEISGSSDYCLGLLENERDYKYYFRFPSLEALEAGISLNRFFVRKGAFSVPLRFKDMKAAVEAKNPERSGADYLDLPAIKSRYRNIRQYYSFRNILPKCYMVGDKGMSQYATPFEKEQSKYLKDYLSIFEQFLYDYLVRLSSLDGLFSVGKCGCPGEGSASGCEEGAPSDPNPKWFHDVLPGRDMGVVTGEDLCAKKNGYLSYVKSRQEIVRDKTLDYLLSRFNETFPEYVRGAYGCDVDENSPMKCKLEEMASCFYPSLGLGDEDPTIDRNAYEDKKNLLREYPEISRNRSLSINIGETGNKKKPLDFSGVEKRILRKLGINDLVFRITPSREVQGRSSLRRETTNGYYSSFGLHILEHILFFPEPHTLNDDSFLELSKNEHSADLVEDPYSFHVTVILPGWLSFTQDVDYREFAEQVIREELPAHIISKICWVSPSVMRDVEDMLELLYRSDGSFKSNVEKNIKEIKKVFNLFRNVYPIGEPLDMSEQRIDFVRLPDMMESMMEQVEKPGKERELLDVDPSSSQVAGATSASADQVLSILQSVNRMPSVLQSVAVSAQNKEESVEKNESSSEQTASSETRRLVVDQDSSPNLSVNASPSKEALIMEPEKKAKSSTAKNAKKTSEKKTKKTKKL